MVDKTNLLKSETVNGHTVAIWLSPCYQSWYVKITTVDGGNIVSNAMDGKNVLIAYDETIALLRRVYA